MGSPFWDFSIAIYGDRAVQEECLQLQDRFGLDVNLVLLCVFLGAVHGLALTSDDIASAREEVRQWQNDIVRPLRNARRSLKTIATQGETAIATISLRTQVKAVELEAERIEQTLLERWADGRFAARTRSGPGKTVAANLQVLLTAYGIGPDRLAAAAAVPHIIAAALAR